MKSMNKKMTTLEICAGGGGQAIGLEKAGFNHAALVELDKHACATLRLNRPNWNVIEANLIEFDGNPYRGIDLLSGGVPCPPFSKAGKQLGEADERNLFPVALRLVEECQPKAVMLENVRGLSDDTFKYYRDQIDDQLIKLGYTPDWKLLNSCDFGVSQLRPRFLLVAIKNEYANHFTWPDSSRTSAPTVGQLLYEIMASRGWDGANKWREQANRIAPTIVGGSHKHGGPDLGPTRAKRAWASLGVDGHNIAVEPPGPDFKGMPRLTVEMVALIQGFPPDWKFSGRKTNAYRQVGNAFPPPVAEAVARQIRKCLTKENPVKVKRTKVMQVSLPYD